MIENFIISQICRQLPFEANDGQKAAIAQMARFLTSQKERKTFILRGYAGTGKTSLVSALVRAMQTMQQTCVLLAPTGRAAKVMSHYAGVNAFTIHKWIYRGTNASSGESGAFALADNRTQHTLYIVDEASMISADRDNPTFGSGSLLDDLIRFVFACPVGQTQSTNALLLVGDNAQLPPVGHTDSPALDEDFLCGYGLSLLSATLTEVARQALDSGILKNATRIRATDNTDFSLTAEQDVHLLSSQDFAEAIERAYAEVGVAETVILTRSNRRTNLYNQGIRAQIMFYEDLLTSGDRLMISRNNYFWTQQYDNLPFLANGDTVEVLRLRNEREMYGFHFVDVQLRALDYDWEIDATLWTDTLTTSSPDENYQLQQQLYQRIAEDYPEIRNKRELNKQIRQSPYYNALQVRFAYAITCHKAQGGQWDRVFIDAGTPLPDERPEERQRWMYTALTRAKQEVFQLVPEYES